MAAAIKIPGVAIRPFSPTGTRAECERGVRVADRPGTISHFSSMGKVEINNIVCSGPLKYFSAPIVDLYNGKARYIYFLAQEYVRVTNSDLMIVEASIGDDYYDTGSPLQVNGSRVGIQTVDCSRALSSPPCRIAARSPSYVVMPYSGDPSLFTSTSANPQAYVFRDGEYGDDSWPHPGNIVGDGFDSWVEG